MMLLHGLRCHHPRLMPNRWESSASPCLFNSVLLHLHKHHTTHYTVLLHLTTCRSKRSCPEVQLAWTKVQAALGWTAEGFLNRGWRGRV